MPCSSWKTGIAQHSVILCGFIFHLEMSTVCALCLTLLLPELRGTCRGEWGGWTEGLVWEIPTRVGKIWIDSSEKELGKLIIHPHSSTVVWVIVFFWF